MEITDLANGNVRFQMKIGGASEEFRGILDKIDIEVRKSCDKINKSLLLWCKLRKV